MATASLELKLEGNTHYKSGKFLNAIECYDQALQRTKNEEEAVTLLLNRCLARINLEAYDAAFEDAKAALSLQAGKGNEKALFRASRALYSLRRFKESLEHLLRLISIYPKNTDAQAEIKRCKARLREENGEYEFAALLTEATAKYPKPDMDRADYIGAIDIRQCAIPSHGRGIFATRDIKVGELILCEKAFMVAFAKDIRDVPKDDAARKEEEEKEKMRLRAEIATKCFVKLHQNPSFQPAFGELFMGPDYDDDLDEQGNVVCDDTFVQLRIIYNAFGFPLLSHRHHHDSVHSPQSITAVSTGSRGVWLYASAINHSCAPTVRRSFIGDMMIWRAQCDIPKDTELKFGYISCMESFEHRKKALGNYGFECDCEVCDAERRTSKKKFRKRERLTKEIIERFERDTPTPIEEYFGLLDGLETTYVVDPTIQPRLTLITPTMHLLAAARQDSQWLVVSQLVHKLLNALGFETETTDTSFKVTRWGFLIDELVIALLDLCDACREFQPAWLPDVEGVAKMVYLIMCGEVESWRAAGGIVSEGSEARMTLEKGGK